MEIENENKSSSINLSSQSVSECEYDKFIICEICKLKFTSEPQDEINVSRNPIALPCGHTFCFQCLKDEYKIVMYIQCVKCNMKYFQDLSKLPVNKFVLRLIQKFKESKGGNKSKKFEFYFFRLFEEEFSGDFGF